MVDIIANYIENKKRLEVTLSDVQSKSELLHNEIVRNVENKLEKSFEKILAVSPLNLFDAAEKATVLIDEVIAEAELTSYHASALRVILSDLIGLAKADLTD